MSVKEDDKPVSATSERVLFPCTPTQERSWFLNQFRPEDSSFSVAVLWEIRGAFDTATFEEAFRIIVQRHEILRTRFVEIDGQPVQEMLERAAFNLSVIDVSILPAATGHERARTICERESTIPFDLRTPPLMRATLIRFDDSNAQLLIVAHPSVFDGWSIGVLGRELGEIVSALRARRSHALPELALQYGDYALWYREYMSKGGIDDDARYWQHHLRNVPYFEVAADHPRPEERSLSSGVLARALDADLGERLEAIAKARGVSFFAFGSAIIAAMLRGYTGRSDIVIGTQVAGRNDVDLEPLVGAFVNNLVLRFDASGDRPFSHFLKGVADTVRDSLVHQHMPFDHLVRLLNPPRDMSRMPLYSINVILQPAFMEDAQYADFSLTSAPSPSVGTLTDLNFHMIKRPNGWRMALEYNPDLFEKTTAEQILGHWLAAMKLAVSNTDAMLSEFGQAFMDETTKAAISAPSRRSIAEADGTRTNDAAVLQSNERQQPLEAKDLPVAPQAGQSDAEEIETKVIAIWRDILRTQNLTSDSNFFDLGGHSLSAMRMMARIFAVLGVKAEPGTFFKTPTVAAFSRHVAELRAMDPWRIVSIQPRGSQPPSFAINGATVYYNFYNTLATKLGADQPMFSVQPFDPQVPSDLGDSSMEEMAAEYLRLVRKVNPSGPYVLMGHCVFGVIAFQAAQQLRKEGKSVRAVVMFDSWAPGHLRRQPWHRRFLIRLQSRSQVHQNRIGRVLRREMTIRESLASLHFVRRLYRSLNTASLAGGVWKGLSGDDWFLSSAVRARDHYQLTEYDGDVLLFVSDDCPKGRLFDSNLGWRKFVKGRLSVRRVGGSHMTMGYGPRSSTIAEHIRSFLAKKD